MGLILFQMLLLFILLRCLLPVFASSVLICFISSFPDMIFLSSPPLPLSHTHPLPTPQPPHVHPHSLFPHFFPLFFIIFLFPFSLLMLFLVYILFFFVFSTVDIDYISDYKKMGNSNMKGNQDTITLSLLHEIDDAADGRSRWWWR